jgi:hypothetical protein
MRGRVDDLRIGWNYQRQSTNARRAGRERVGGNAAMQWLG